MNGRRSLYRLVAASLVFLGAACAFSEEISWRNDPAAALAEAKKNNTIVMADVHTDWCGWCHKLDETTYKNPTVISLASKVIPLKINPEISDANAAFVKPFNIEGYPAIVFFDPACNVVDRIDGYLGAGSFAGELSRILKKQRISFVEPEKRYWLADPDAAFKKAAKQHRQVLLYVGADDSDWCAELENGTWMDPGVIKLLKDFECVMIRPGDGPDQSELFRK